MDDKERNRKELCMSERAKEKYGEREEREREKGGWRGRMPRK